MKMYRLNTQEVSSWGTEAYNGMIIDEDEIKRLAREWEKSVDELLEDLEEVEDDN